MTELVWFRNDLRLADNPALTAACAGRAPVEACFLLTPGQWRRHDWSPAKTDLLLRSLRDLTQALSQLGIPLHMVQVNDFSDCPGALEQLCHARSITRVHANEEYCVNERARDRETLKRLRSDSRDLLIYRDQTLVPVDQLLTGKNQPYSVFTPYSRAWWQWLREHPVQLQPRPRGIDEPLSAGEPPLLSEWRSEKARWIESGETGAHRALDRFVETRIAGYRERRDYPAASVTSILSPYLALGILSPRQCLKRAEEALEDRQCTESARTWINEIAWRDFYIQIVYHHPRVSRHRAYRAETESLIWNSAGEKFERWKNGQTGIPIVDAAMRQLNQTGWMHNRLRMVTAMFLSKNLFIDWREGERYFMQQLVDGYLPSNNGGWQWSASTGTDAAPYFRIFNPVTQSERFDPNGEFIRTYVPEIAHLKGKALFNPNGTAEGYPAAMVDLKSSRKEAIARFKALSKPRPQ